MGTFWKIIYCSSVDKRNGIRVMLVRVCGNKIQPRIRFVEVADFVIDFGDVTEGFSLVSSPSQNRHHVVVVTPLRGPADVYQ